MRSFLPKILGVIFLVTFIFVPQVAQADFCTPDKLATLTITPSEKQTIYIHDRSFLSLSKVKSDTVSPYAQGTVFHTFGLAHRKFRLEQRVDYKIVTHPFTKKTCLWIDKVTVKVNLQPTIYVAKEYPPQTCHYNHVRAHEEEHIAVDRAVTKVYLQRLQEELSQFILTNQVYGPVKQNLKNVTAKRLQRDVANKIQSLVKKMEKERAVKQANIDSLASYEASSKYIREVCDPKHPSVAKARDDILRRLQRR